jgi:hypothetical protein
VPVATVLLALPICAVTWLAQTAACSAARLP